MQPATAGELQDVFSVSGVAVDAEAETAAAARELALSAGQREAFRRLLERITSRADYGRHPVMEDAAIIRLIRGIEFDKEKASSVRYLAELTIYFKKDNIRELLRERGLRFSETPSKPILVLAVYEAAGTQGLWDDPNPWREAWSQRQGRDSLVPLLLPVGDLTDVGMIGPAQALAGDEARLAAIAGRYDVKDVIVARARLTVDLAAGTPRLEVALAQYGPSGERTIIETFRGVTREDVVPLLERAVAEVVVELEESWKRETLMRFDLESRLSVTVPLRALSDWLDVRGRLAKVATVRRVELNTLSKASAQVVLHYLGDSVQLSLSLAQHDLKLSEEDGYWSLRLRADATPRTAPAPGAVAAE